MRRRNALVCLGFGLGLILQAQPAGSAEVKKSGAGVERKLTTNQVPKAVLDSFHAGYPKAVIRSIGMEQEQGKKLIEIGSLDGKVHRDLLYTPLGGLIAIEELVPVSSLPEPIRKAIVQKYPKCTMETAERILRGKEVSFEVLLSTPTERWELELDPNGKILATEKVTAESKDADHDRDEGADADEDDE